MFETQSDSNFIPDRKLDDAYGNGAELMLEAARSGDLDTMRYLLLERHPRVDADCRDRDGRTPIMAAAAAGNKNGVVQKLWKLGSDISAKDNMGRQCIHAAAANGDVQLFKWFLKRGANLDSEDKRGRKPFHVAAQTGKVEILEYIRDAKIDELGSKGYTYLQGLDCELNNALHLAAQRGYIRVVRLLVTEGCSSKAKNMFGKSPIEIAQQFNQKSVVTYLDRSGDQDDKAQLRDALLRERNLERENKAQQEKINELSEYVLSLKNDWKEQKTEYELRLIEANAQVKKQKSIEETLREKIEECEVAVISLGQSHDIQVDDLLKKLRRYRGYGDA